MKPKMNEGGCSPSAGSICDEKNPKTADSSSANRTDNSFTHEIMGNPELAPRTVISLPSVPKTNTARDDEKTSIFLQAMDDDWELSASDANLSFSEMPFALEDANAYRASKNSDSQIPFTSDANKLKNSALIAQSACGSPQNEKKSASSPADAPSVVNHNFDGTNEVFVRSSAFDEMTDEANAHDGATSLEIKAIAGDKLPAKPAMALGAARAKSAVFMPKTSESNIIGIIGSGILPSVEIDKSFDIPALDEGILEKTGEHDHAHEYSDNDGDIELNIAKKPPRISPDLIADDKLPTQAVFASRMNNKNLVISSQSQKNDHKTEYGLPTRDAVLDNIPLHPEDEADATARHIACCLFAADALYDPRMLDVGHAEIELQDDSYQSFYMTLAADLLDAQNESKPKFIWLKSPCEMSVQRVIRGFLHRCVDNTPDFSCYSPVQPPDGQKLDLLTAYVCSRVGVFPNDNEDIRKEALIKGSANLFSQSDLRWGLDILLLRFGLNQLVLRHKEIDIAQMISRNGADLRELLLNIIQHDARRGPVAIVLPANMYAAALAWRDALACISHIHSPNILVIITGNDEDIQPLVNPYHIEIRDIPALTLAETRDLLNIVLKSCAISPSTMGRLAAKCQGRYDLMRRCIAILREKAVLVPKQEAQENPQLAPEIEKLGDSPEAIENSYFACFCPDHQKFLSYASLLGNTFFLPELIRLMELEPLPDESQWTAPKRRQWCENIVSSLMTTGELVDYPKNEFNGQRYGVPDAALFRRRFNAIRPDLCQQLHACIGMMLENRTISDHPLAALQFAQSGKIAPYIAHILPTVRDFCSRFETHSALALIQSSISKIGPDAGQVYADCLQCYIAICRQQCCFEAAAQTSAKLLSYYKYTQNNEQACHAIIAYAHSLSMMGQWNFGKTLLLTAVKLAEEAQSDALISDVYMGLAALLYDSGAKGGLVNGLRYAEKSLEIRRRMGDLCKIGQAQSLCAQIYMHRGEPERAKEAASEAIHAMSVSGHWYDACFAWMVMAEASAALNEGLPMDHIRRALDIVQKTENLNAKFNLIAARIRLMMNTLDRQQVREDLDTLADILSSHPLMPWKTRYLLLKAQFDFARKNFKKTTLSLKNFFEAAQILKSAWLLSCGYSLSAALNLEVYKRGLGTISIDKTEKLNTSAISVFESIGAWHQVAESLRHYALFLDSFNRPQEADKTRSRADKVDPYCQ